MKPHVDRQRCIGCGMCKDLCPSGMFQMTVTKSGKMKAETRDNPDCIGCMTCVVNCDKDAIHVN